MSNDTNSIDFSVYRRPELAENISRIINLPRAIAMVLGLGALGVLVVWFLLWYAFADLATQWLALIGIYGTVVGLLVGLAWGVLAAMNRSLTGIVELVDLLLDLSAQAYVDARKARSGNVSLREIVDGVYHQVLFPTVSDVIRRQAFLLGRLFVLAYGFTLHRAVKYVIGLIPETNVDDREQQVAEASEDGNRYVQAVTRHLTKARDFVSRGTSALRKVVIWPAVVAVSLLTFVGAFPLILVLVLQD